ncbi:MAG: phenylacetate--CoA ligase family protein [Promethearchaeota archaeon]
MSYFPLSLIQKFKLYRKNKAKTLKKYREFDKNQYLSKKELDSLIREKLLVLLQHSQENVPYYTKIFNEIKLNLNSFTMEDFQKIPILTKQICQENFSDLLAQNMRRDQWDYHSTSGSTGEPFQFRIDKHFGIVRGAIQLLFDQWMGYQRRKDRILHIVGHCPNSVVSVLYNRYGRKTACISAWDAEDEDKLKEIISFKPKYIYGYTSAILKLATYLEENNINLKEIKAVVTTSETLTREQRERIETGFRAPVFDQYGSREFGFVAGECQEHKGLHIVEESFIVEIIKNNFSESNRNIGKLIITCLDNFSMPFIRYDTGDLVEDNTVSCTCGRTLKLIPHVLGRITDFITLPSGNKISFLFFNSFFEDYGPYISEFQVIQLEKCLLIKVVPTENFTLEIRNNTINGISKIINFELEVKIQEVAHIPLESSGKRLVIKKFQSNKRLDNK